VSFFTRARVSGQRPKVTFDRFLISPSPRRGYRPATARRPASRLDPRRSRGARRRITVAAVAERWITEVANVHNKPRTIADYETLLAKYILPLGHLLISAVAHDDVVQLHTAGAHAAAGELHAEHRPRAVQLRHRCRPASTRQQSGAPDPLVS
jgi:hypothetical protein